MLRGPNLFQRGARSALADNLVEAPRGLPGFRAQAGGVGTPQPLPGLIPFGPSPPGVAQSSRFTGGTVPSPLNLTRGDQTPGFTQPNYGGGLPVGPVGPTHAMSPLIQALSSASTLPQAPTGATSGGMPPGPQPTRAPVIFDPNGPQPTRAPVTFDPNGPAPTQPTSPALGLSALLAALAQRGQKLSPGGGGGMARAL